MGRVVEAELVDAESGELVVSTLEVADGYWSRLAGLQFRRDLQEGRGLLLVPCRSLHTHWMRFAIDVAMLDDSGCVLEVRRDVRPWRIVMPQRRPHAVLEMRSGSPCPEPGQRIAVRSSGVAALPRSLGFLPRVER